MDESVEVRLWKVLDDITSRLGAIEAKLTEIVRLEERVNSHEQSLQRCHYQIDEHDKRVHQIEIWQAGQGDRKQLEAKMTQHHTDLNNIREKIDLIESTQDKSAGQKDVTKVLLQWISGILAAILTYKLTKGS